MDFVWSALIWLEIIAGLGLLIFIHEFGHFLMAKRNGVRVEAFSLGMGPILWRRQWGETEYRLSLVPLGGYVKMSGENLGDPRTGAEHELTSKSAWQRLQIFSAGAIMNLLIAVPISVAAFGLGMYMMPATVAAPALLEAEAGMRPGDVVTEIAGRRVASLDSYKKEIVRQPRGSQVPVKVLRDGKELTLTVQAGGSEKHGFRPPLTSLGKVKEGSLAATAGFRTGDEVVEIDGQRVLHYVEIREGLDRAAGREAVVKVRNVRDDGAPIRELRFQVPALNLHEIPQDWDLVEIELARVPKGFPAEQAGLQPGDVITRIGDRECKSFADVKAALEKAGGTAVGIEYLRQGATAKATVKVGFNEIGRGQIGVEPKKTKRVARVAEGSYFHAAGLRTGDMLESLDSGKGTAVTGDVTTWDLAMGRSDEPGRFKPTVLEVLRDGKKERIEVKGRAKVVADVAGAGFQSVEGQLALAPSMAWQTWTFGEAVQEGIREPGDIFVLTFQLLGKLVKGQESTSNLSGPVGIISVAHEKAAMSPGNFLWLLMLISVNLGVFNLLPIPVLDGGHILLLLFEKVKGRPLSPGFVERFQLVGVVFLLGLIIYVTMNDFGRHFR